MLYLIHREGGVGGLGIWWGAAFSPIASMTRIHGFMHGSRREEVGP